MSESLWFYISIETRFLLAMDMEVSLPDVPVAASPAEVRVKAVERNVETLDFSNAEAPLAMLAHSPLTSVRKYGTIPVLSPKRMTV